MCVVTPVLSARHCHGVCCELVSFRVSEVLTTNLHCYSNFCVFHGLHFHSSGKSLKSGPEDPPLKYYQNLTATRNEHIVHVGNHVVSDAVT